MTDLELYWLAGWLEGEGSFCKAPPSSSPNRIGIYGTSTDKDTIDKICAMTGARQFEEVRHKRKPHYKKVYRFAYQGQKAADLMVILKPLMSIRRQQQIQAVLDTHHPKYKRRVSHTGSSGKTLASKTD